MFKKLIDNISYIGLSFKRELIIFISLNLLMVTGGILLIIFKMTNFIILIYFIFIPLVDYLYLGRYKNLMNKIDDNHNNEFISLLSYFEIYISNKNNVYKSIEMLIPFSSDWMGERLSNLLKEIDLDKSVVPYVRFAKNFTFLVIENVMISIYQMVEDGGDEKSLAHFDFVFSSLYSSLSTSKISRHEKNMDALNAFPLFGAGLITVTLTLSIIALLGELTNVI